MHSRVFYRTPVIIVFLFALFGSSVVQCKALYGQAEIAQSAIDERVDADGLVFTLDESSTAFRLALGYEWSRYVSVEAGYDDFGEVDAKLVAGTAEAEADGFEFAFVFRWPLTDRFSLTGRGGLLWWDAETRIAGAAGSDSGSDALFGAGAEFNASERVAITAGWSRYRLDDLDVDYASLGLRFRFGLSD